MNKPFLISLILLIAFLFLTGCINNQNQTPSEDQTPKIVKPSSIEQNTTNLPLNQPPEPSSPAYQEEKSQTQSKEVKEREANKEEEEKVKQQPNLIPKLDMQEVKKHNSSKDCYTVIDGKVYNLSPFIAKNIHPPAILKACGKDGTELFYNREGIGPHPASALAVLEQYYIGELEK
ncbi:MAG: cytochrome b5 domain-containing protein [Candidatus Micrarchaeota archaeon]|nr:cytochrome b5 domain-containing protein [Candidatus Micrarchaeota archaeon]